MPGSDFIGRVHVPQLAGILILAGVGGCQPVCKNQPLERYEPHGGYRFEAIEPGPGNTEKTFVFVAFSGGGTRAAALAYGVLLGLRDAEIGDAPAAGAARAPADTAAASPPRHRLLDEVDVISGVSGGSFTAMYYGLNRDATFDGSFEKRFLRRNVQRTLILDVLNPLNVFRLANVLTDRIDLAAAYYDRHIFDGATYAKLVERGDRPLVVVNAMNMATGERFEFTQRFFDLLGSDLASLPVAYAVAASSAFPVLFSPVRLKYYPSPPGANVIHEVLTAPEASWVDPWRYRWAQALCPPAGPGEEPSHTLDEERHRYLYLLDGGVVDNLGVVGFLSELYRGRVRQKIRNGEIDKLVVIVVDAAGQTPVDFESKSSAPGMLVSGVRTGSTGVSNFTRAMSTVTQLLVRDIATLLEQFGEEYDRNVRAHCPQAPPLSIRYGREVKTYLVNVNLQAVADPKDRRRCLAMPTSFALPERDVELLISSGRSVLAAHPEFQRLMADLKQP